MPPDGAEGNTCSCPTCGLNEDLVCTRSLVERDLKHTLPRTSREVDQNTCSMDEVTLINVQSNIRRLV